MDAQGIPFRITATRFTRAVANLVNSPVGGKAKLMALGLVLLLCGANGLNVVNSYVGRDFMTAIANRNSAEFVRQAMFYLVVFGGSTCVAVAARFTEERLSLLWREDLTRRILRRYLANDTYYRLEASGELQSPDQRISEDARTFTVTTLSFVIMALNSVLAMVSFSGVLWAISPLLFVIAVAYAACGSLATIALGRPLVRLNSNQLDFEASFRSNLLHVREHAEQVMIGRQESLHEARLHEALDRLLANFRQITSVNRNVGAFTTAYNWLIQIIPALVIAPAFIAHNVEFGVIGQSAMAFTALVAAFSLIVTQFQSLSNFAAVIARLSAMVEAVEQSGRPAKGSLRVERSGDQVRFEELTIDSDQGERLVETLSLAVPRGARALVTGPNEAARVALFRAAAGVDTRGGGLIVLPAGSTTSFLPERPYLPRSSLKRTLAGADRPDDGFAEKAIAVLRALAVEDIVSRVRGWDVEQDWTSFLSLPEQQLLAVARALLSGSGTLFFDRVEAVLGRDRFVRLMTALTRMGVTVISNGAANADPHDYDAVLECLELRPLVLGAVPGLPKA